jgi:hypothetical protein
MQIQCEPAQVQTPVPPPPPELSQLTREFGGEQALPARNWQLWRAWAFCAVESQDVRPMMPMRAAMRRDVFIGFLLIEIRRFGVTAMGNAPWHADLSVES